MPFQFPIGFIMSLDFSIEGWIEESRWNPSGESSRNSSYRIRFYLLDVSLWYERLGKCMYVLAASSY
jgi:hypothetical protein